MISLAMTPFIYAKYINVWMREINIKVIFSLSYYSLVFKGILFKIQLNYVTSKYDTSIVSLSISLKLPVLWTYLAWRLFLDYNGNMNFRKPILMGVKQS